MLNLKLYVVGWRDDLSPGQKVSHELSLDQTFDKLRRASGPLLGLHLLSGRDELNVARRDGLPVHFDQDMRRIIRTKQRCDVDQRGQAS